MICFDGMLRGSPGWGRHIGRIGLTRPQKSVQFGLIIL